jgi:hypothetical protein
MTEPRSIPTERDPDLVNAEIALKRAARLVREEARRSGTALAYVEDGELKMERPTDEPEEDTTRGAGQ